MTVLEEDCRRPGAVCVVSFVEVEALPSAAGVVDAALIVD